MLYAFIFWPGSMTCLEK